MQYPDKTHHLLCQAPNPLTSSNIVWGWQQDSVCVSANQCPLQQFANDDFIWLHSPGSPSPPHSCQLHTASWGGCGPPEDIRMAPPIQSKTHITKSSDIMFPNENGSSKSYIVTNKSKLTTPGGQIKRNLYFQWEQRYTQIKQMLES